MSKSNKFKYLKHELNLKAQIKTKARAHENRLFNARRSEHLSL